MIVHTIQNELFLTSVPNFFFSSQERRCSRETAENVMRRAPNGDDSGDIAALARIVRVTTSQQAENNNTFRQYMSENAGQIRRLQERMDQRVTAVEGTVQQQGRHLQQVDHNVTDLQETVQQQERELDDLRKEVRRDVDGLREEFRRFNAALDSEEATIVVDDNQVAKKPNGFDVGERFPALNNMLPEPGQNGFKKKEDCFFHGKTVVVGKDFSCHARVDVVTLVENFGGRAMKNVKAGYGEYRSLTLTCCIV